jgi:N-acetyl-gamma-glutamyl-phosphate reductase common form
MSSFETLVLGASGYVGAECLRLIHAHPSLKLTAAVSESRADSSIESLFPYLQSSFDLRFRSPEEIPAILETSRGPLAVFSAASHGVSAGLVGSLVETAKKKGVEVRVVDMSADFRYRDAAAYQKVYGKEHGAPDLLSRFVCGVPEHVSEWKGTPHAAQPGCFTTAVVLALVPLLKLDMIHPEVFVSGITGSTGSGREPKPTTHHPERHSNLFAYQALAHRHLPEMVSLAEQAAGARPTIHFVPLSGPFARGIHATVQARLRTPIDAETIRGELAHFYEGSPFVRIVAGTPRVKDVVGSNFAHLGVAADGETVAVLSVIDNLVKGAAGGAMQWMNRLLELPESTGLTQPGPGWI